MAWAMGHAAHAHGPWAMGHGPYGPARPRAMPHGGHGPWTMGKYFKGPYGQYRSPKLRLPQFQLHVMMTPEPLVEALADVLEQLPLSPSDAQVLVGGKIGVPPHEESETPAKFSLGTTSWAPLILELILRSRPRPAREG